MAKKRVVAIAVICLGVSTFALWNMWGKNKGVAGFILQAVMES